MKKYALAVLETNAGSAVSTHGTRAQLHCPDGDAGGYLTFVNLDRRNGTATYALHIENSTASPLVARLQCMNRRGRRTIAYPVQILVAAHSVKESLLPVRLQETGPFDRAIVEVQGADVAFSLEAPAPPRWRRATKWLAWTGGSLAFTLVASFGVAASAPRITVFDAPAKAVAGTFVDIPYEAAGFGTLQYSFEGNNGRRFAAGIAPAAIGTLHLAVPKDAPPHAMLRVRFDGPLGTVERSGDVAIERESILLPKAAHRAANPGSSQPLIGDLSVAPSPAIAGEMLRVSYTTRATQGEVWLLDLAGRLYAKVPLSFDGTTWLRLPANAAGREMRVVLHVADQKQQGVSGIGIVVMPGADSQSTAQAQDAAKTLAGAVPAVGHAVTLTLSTNHALAGDAVTAILHGSHGDARVTLTDNAGTVIERGDVPSGQDAVSLTTPSSQTAMTYFVVANVPHGSGEETLVQKVSVAPAH